LQEGLTPKKIDYYWIELAPMLVLLVLVVIALAVIPNCQDNSNCVRYSVSQNIDINKLSEGLENVFNNTNVEIP